MAYSVTDSLYSELVAIEGNNGQNYETGISTDKSFLSEYSNRLFGAPFQLLDSVDKRIPEINSYLGNEYLRNFMLNSPILHIRPGMPQYTGDKDATSLSNMVKNIYSNIVLGDMEIIESALRETGTSLLFGAGKKLQSRMFGFRETYYEYIQNVNYMCRSAATYMSLVGGDSTLESIRSEMPDGCYVSKNEWQTFDKIDWQNYRMMAETNATDPLNKIIEHINVVGDNLGGLTGAFVGSIANGIVTDEATKEWVEGMQQMSASSLLGVVSSTISSVEFMVEPISFNEVLNNTTANSMIEGTIDGVRESVGSELAWITNSNADVGIIDNLTNFLGDGLSAVSEVVGGLVQGTAGGFTKNLFSGAIASLKGQKMIYPKIYKSSESHMDYQFSITLTTPYGDPYNYYMNIIVPLMHLIALAAPRMVTSNTVASPFLVQAYIPGMCTCQLGIIQNMKITKNPTSKHVSVNGFPLTVKVDFDIEELYNAMSISPANDPASFMFNETLNDYLCNISGLAPSVETYAVQRQSMFQAVNRYFDKGLVVQDWAASIVEAIENPWVKR